MPYTYLHMSVCVAITLTHAQFLVTKHTHARPHSQGFSKTRIITWDNWAWSAPNGSDAMGVHYPGVSPLPAGAVANGLPAWSSEESSTYNNQFGAECWARVVNQNYAVGNLTASIIWNLASGYMKGTK